MDSQLQIRLVTKQEANAVVESTISVPASLNRESLNELVNQLLREKSPNFDDAKPKQFDFIILEELLRTSLSDHLHEKSISTETTVDVEYIERTPAPEPQDSLLHDDWVSGIETCDKWILTGCYDNSVNIWTTHGKMVASIKEHSQAVKAVTWIDPSDPSRGFVSASHDLTAILWEWESGTDNPQPKIALRGHEKGIDTVKVSPNSLHIATGGWDTNLKIWDASFDSTNAEPVNKKSKGPNALLVKTPFYTASGHKEAITSIDWISSSTVCTASMDHTIKLWNIDAGVSFTNEVVTQKALLGVSWSPLANAVIACSADRYIRLYDPRSSEGSVCKTTFTSHTLWVSSVKWSKYDEHLFVSGGYDSCVKLWDTRSPKAALYDLQGHQGQVLAVDWSNNKYLVSGGSDNCVHVFQNKHY